MSLSTDLNEMPGDQPAGAVFVLQRLVLHVGPHKTATTTLQELLAANRDALRASGVVYPEGQVFAKAHHEIPYHLLGWDLSLLSETEVDFDLIGMLAQVLTEARASSADTLVLSAEDFSILDSNQWLSFSAALSEAIASSGVAVSSIVVTYTDRELQQRVRSLSAEYLKHGSALESDERIHEVTELLTDRQRILETLPGLLPSDTMMLPIEFHSSDRGLNFLQKWSTAVLGADVEARIDFNLLGADLNQSLEEQLQGWLLVFNKVNTSPVENKLLPFNPLVASGDAEERQKARSRFMLFRQIVIELGVLRAEIDRLRALLSQAEADQHELTLMKSSISWKITKPLRGIRSLFRR